MLLSKETFNALDLSWLTLRPKIPEKGCSIAYRLRREVMGDDRTIKMSSANSIHLCSLSLHSIHGTSGQLWIFIASGSIARMNSNGDKGHPCPIPLHMARDREEYPLNIKDALGVSYNA